jgi:teichuronic acid biosynthesis glycosyltransferase TuaG
VAAVPPQGPIPPSPQVSAPTVSVVVPSYNAAATLGDTIASVLAQTFTDFEVIVVDDCSTDSTLEVVRAIAERDSRVRTVRLPRNKGGPAGPRNEGVRQARGRWIAFLDADDIWHPKKLECQLAVLEQTGAKFCSTRMVDFTDPTALHFSETVPKATKRIGFLSELFRNQLPTSSVVVAAEVIREVMFNEDPNYRAREDHDAWLHCHERLGFSIKLMAPLIGYRISPGQISANKLTMMRRHNHVLANYRRLDGRQIGWLAPLFTGTHFALSLYYRLLRREL